MSNFPIATVRWTKGPYQRRADRPQPTRAELAATRYLQRQRTRLARWKRQRREEQ